MVLDRMLWALAKYSRQNNDEAFTRQAKERLKATVLGLDQLSAMFLEATCGE